MLMNKEKGWINFQKQIYASAFVHCHLLSKSVIFTVLIATAMQSCVSWMEKLWKWAAREWRNVG